jgi:hypothetical protein
MAIFGWSWGRWRLMLDFCGVDEQFVERRYFSLFLFLL